MGTSAISRRYAKALIDIGKEEGAVEKFGAELRDWLKVTEESPELAKVLLNPMFKLEERMALAGSVSDKLSSSPQVKRFIGILVEKGKIGFLDDISSAYLKFEDDLLGRLRATVVSPGAADEAFLASVKEKLGTETGKEIIISNEVDPGLIGGFVIRLENTVFDGSLKVQLELMREKMLGGAV